MSMNEFWLKTTHNLPAKIISISLAIILYLSNQMISLETKNFAIPITVKETGAMVITNTLPKTVQVSIKSKAENVSDILASDITLELDTRQYLKSGGYDIPLVLITSSKLVTMETIEIEVLQKTVFVNLQKRISKWVSLIPDYTGECAHGYQVSNCTFTPDLVRISSSEDTIKLISALKADKIILSDKNKSFETVVFIQNFSNALLIDKPDTIMASVEIEPIFEAQLFTDVAVRSENLSTNLEIVGDLPKIAIELYGTQLDIESYKSTLITVVSDYSDITEAGEYTIPLRIFVSQRFETRNIDPAMITVQIRKITQEEIGDSELDGDTTESTDGATVTNNVLEASPTEKGIILE